MTEPNASRPSTEAALPPPRSTSPWPAAIVGGAVGGGLMLALLWLPDGPLRDLESGGGAWRLLAAVVVCGPLAIVCHEAAHLIGAAMGGLRAEGLIFGPLYLHRHAGRWRLGLNRSLGLWGGAAVAVPGDAGVTRGGFALFVAAGPVGSLLLAAATAAAGLPLEPGAARTWLLIFATVSLGLGLVTLLPVRNGPLPNDGLRLLRALRRDAAWERDAAIFAAVGLSRSGTPAANWPPELVASLTSHADGTTEECAARLLAYEHHRDRGDTESARAHLARAADLARVAPAMLRSAVDTEVSRNAGNASGTP